LIRTGPTPEPAEKKEFHAPSVPAELDISELEPEYAPQWVSEGSTSESENAKEVWKVPLLVTKTHLFLYDLGDNKGWPRIKS
jgi:hypothetical protein